jgi:Protein of unknown function (DUF3467)
MFCFSESITIKGYKTGPKQTKIYYNSLGPHSEDWGRAFFEQDSTRTRRKSVAKSDDKQEKGTEAQAPETKPVAAPAGQQHRPQIQLDDSHTTASYANFCRVTGTPEELIIDFGLNPQPFGVPTQPIPVTQRLITNFYTAKRMLHALTLTIQRHEATFGVLETDVQKRVQPGAGQPPQPPKK